MSNSVAQHHSFSTTSSAVADLKRLSPQRWESFLFLYSPMLRFWLHVEKVPPNAIEDLLQESLRSIYIGIGNFQRSDARGSFRGWLRTIVRRRVADYRRRIHKSIATQEFPLENLPVLELHDNDSENEALRDVIARACHVVRQSVKPQTWQMFQMCVLENQSAEDVAKSLGVNSANVRMAKARILKQLRELLVDFG